MAKPTLTKSNKFSKKNKFFANKTRLEIILLTFLLLLLCVIIALYFLLNKKEADITQTATPVKQLAESEVNQQNTGTPEPTTPSDNNTTSPSTNKSTTTASSSTSSTPSSSPAPASTPFSVSAVTASVNPSFIFMSCNEYQNFTFTGTITATAAGNATYYWARSDGATGPPTTINFASAGSKQVTDTWMIGGYNEKGAFAITGWEKVVVTSPNAVSSNNAGFNINFGCL